MSHSPGELPGLDLHKLGAWISREHPHLVGSGALSGKLITGGLSNLSYAIMGGARPWVLRRPPLGHVLSSAHDMRREFRVLTALRDSVVPVPETEIFYDDTDGSAGVGTPFYLMEFVSGATISHPTHNMEFSPRELRSLSLGLGATLAQLHEINPESIGLGDFGKPDGFLSRQSSRWMTQFELSRSRPIPDLEALALELPQGLPETTMVSILHGDFRLDNTLISRDDNGSPSISAVLDWEMSTLGDTLTDLGLFGLYWDLHSLEGASATALASAIDPSAGYAEFKEIVEHYAQARDFNSMPDLSWYLAFASFKLAVILEGIHYRFTQGQTAGEGFEAIGTLVAPLARRGRAYLDNS